MDIANTLKVALVEQDSKRARSTQREIGASSVGGCARQAWHIINQTPKTNFDTDKLAAIIGTAIHSTISQALQEYDVFGSEFDIEFPLQIPELRGNCDFYVRSTKTIYDWKSVTLKKLADGSWLDKQKKMQVSLYAYMRNQIEPDSVERVGLVAIPRDGRFRDLAVWEDDYNESLALEGLEWLRKVREATQAPKPERTRNFCVNFCEYYDSKGTVGCPSATPYQS